MSGYSGTPLPKKLSIKEASTVVLVSAPDRFEETLGEAEPLGGKHLTEPMDIPDGQIAHFADPEGHVIGLARAPAIIALMLTSSRGREAPDCEARNMYWS